MAIESVVDLGHIRRMTDPDTTTQPDLAFGVEAPDGDKIEGPRISLRYGSAATEIWVSKRLWRRTDRGDPFSYLGRWRSIDDFREAENCVGKLALVRGSDAIGVVTEDEDGFLEVDDVEEPKCGGGMMQPGELRIIPHPDHLNRFEQAIKAHLSA
jgi:hypothetical protein